MNDHGDCRSPRCGCSCHRQVEEAVKVPETGPEKACPKCGTKRPFSETFCRLDGERLASLLCGMCNAGMNPEDAFCYACGAPKGAVGKVKLPQVVTVPAVEVETDYGNQVLKALQREIANDGQQGEQDQPQVVVEQPAGSQGTFKLVSKPNPNKIRGPIPGPNGGSAPRIRLPIKPS